MENDEGFVAVISLNSNYLEGQAYRDPLQHILEEALQQYRRHIQSSSNARMTNTYPVELCFITCQSPSLVEAAVMKSFKAEQLSFLRKIQIVTVNSFSNPIIPSPVAAHSNTSQDSLEMNDNVAVSGMFERTGLENDYMCFDHFFKGWLLDCGTDIVQFILKLPSQEDKELSIKCDLVDVIINPLCISGGSQMMIQTALNRLGNASSLVGSRSVTSPVPVYRMVAKELVELDSLCESVPVVVKATSCWKLDWEDLDNNQQTFAAICDLLQEQGCALLVREEEKRGSNIQGLYLLIPSPNQTLLLKSIAVRDVMMPAPFNTSISWKQNAECTTLIRNALDMLHTETSFNPLQHTSCLTEQLVSSINKSAKPTSKGPVGGKRTVVRSQPAAQSSTNSSRSKITPVFNGRGKKSAASSLLYSSMGNLL